jgi:hypothetical protein
MQLKYPKKHLLQKLKQRKMLKNNYLSYILIFTVIFLLSCHQKRQEVRFKNIGPYTFCGAEYQIDYKRVEILIDSLKRSFKQYNITENTDGFCIFRDSLNRTNRRQKCMLGLILTEDEIRNLPENTRKNFAIQQMGFTQSAFIEHEKQILSSFSSSVQDAQKLIFEFLKKNNMKTNPMLCIFRDNKVQFSVQAESN